jgi:DNA-binding protein HU-beta
MMIKRMQKKALIVRVAQRAGVEEALAGELVEATLEEIYEALKRGQCVSLRNFGTFYVRAEGRRWVFKFNPA